MIAFQPSTKAIQSVCLNTKLLASSTTISAGNRFVKKQAEGLPLDIECKIELDFYAQQLQTQILKM